MRVWEEIRINMAEIKLYHGSNIEVYKPKILVNSHYKDFGYGFYCTNIEKQAKRWAITRRRESVVNCYIYRKKSEYATLGFNDMTEEWLDFVVDCRKGIEHDFDIVEGPMADDQIWDYVEDYTLGRISRSAFWELVKFRHPTHQIVFCTERLLSTLTYERSYSL